MSDNKIVIASAIKNAPKASRSKKSSAPEQEFDKEMPYDISFPEGCPIVPLGINGDDVFFLDEQRQLRILKSDKLNKGTITALFCKLQDLKYTYWPRYNIDGKGKKNVNGWRPEQAADCLLQEASRRGIWDVFERVRGPGCWKDVDGQLVMHCGDVLYHNDKALTPSQIGRHVYPAAPPRPHPGRGLDGLEDSKELLALLRTWNWRRPDLDPALLLGWIGAAILGGALKWRPMVWITGDKATGKSTLHDVMKGVLGEGGLISSTDATAAGLWQTVGHASLPVALDELEAEADNRKQQNIIKLARQASSAGQTLRGSSDHKNASFTVRSCFLFSSILIPPMLGQDISRMAILQLDKLDTSKPPVMDSKMLGRIGDAIRERLMRHWHRLPDVLHMWQARLAQEGHSGRSCDQFGTLMACYDLLTSDTLPQPEDLDYWATMLKRQGLAECEEDISDQERCISFLLTAQLDMFRSGERRTVGSWILQAAGKEKGKDHPQDIDEANRALGNVGLRVGDKNFEGVAGAHKFLFVSNDHQGLAQIFKDTHWSGMSGTNGVWVQAMRRIKHNFADQQRFNGVKKRCTAIPVDQLFGGDDE